MRKPPSVSSAVTASNQAWRDAMASKIICSVGECGKPIMAKGLCTMHYTRLRRGGSLSINRTPPGKSFEFALSLIDTDEKDCIIWPFYRNSYGYGEFRFNNKNTIVSRFICSKVNGDRGNEFHASHVCGKGHLGCVNPNHLKWKTPKENSEDKKKHGTYLKGTQCFGAKITEIDVLDIRSSKENAKSIAKTYGISVTQVYNVKSGESWGWVK